MIDSIPIFCSCGKAVPAFYYCNACKKPEGSPNCPCGKPIKGVRVEECPACAPARAAIISTFIRTSYFRRTGICETGDCTIPECPTCKRSAYPIVRCTVCAKDECDLCARICKRTLEVKNEPSKSAPTVTYSGKARKYKTGDDKDRPRMFVESWVYKGDKCVQRTLVGFKKEGEIA